MCNRPMLLTAYGTLYVCAFTHSLAVYALCVQVLRRVFLRRAGLRAAATAAADRRDDVRRRLDGDDGRQ